MPHILLVEDSHESKLMVKHALADSGYDLVVAESVDQAMSIILNSGFTFSLAILDLYLPDGDGFKVFEALNSTSSGVMPPVFFLTSASELESKVKAFNLGADDYLVKPVSPVELRARVRMRLLKSSTAISEVIDKGGIRVDLTLLKASIVAGRSSRDLELTGKEFKILAYMIQNEGRIFKRSELVKALWGDKVHVLDRSVDSHIYGLRKKLGELSHYIKSHPNVGYGFSTQII